MSAVNINREFKVIEKKIHYIWLGNGRKSELVNSCIQSWKAISNDVEVIEWNESNLDLDQIIKDSPFVKVAYKRKLWAYVSDYIRLKVLYEHGGIYLDTDVSLIKNLSPILESEKLFMGRESDEFVNGAIIGSCKGHEFIGELINFYDTKILEYDFYTIPRVITHVYNSRVDNGDIKIYPKDFFYPYHFTEEFKPDCITKNTYAIHWWGHSWSDNPNLAFIETKHLSGLNKLVMFTLRYVHKVCKKRLRLIAQAFS